MYAPKNASEAAREISIVNRAHQMGDAGYTACFVTPLLAYVRKPGSDFPEYQVDLLSGTCDCPHFQSERTPGLCKHLLFVKEEAINASLLQYEPDAHEAAIAAIFAQYA